MLQNRSCHNQNLSYCTHASRPTGKTTSSNEKCLKNAPRKVLSSSKIPNNSLNSQSCSSNVTTGTKKLVKPKKTTKSDFSFTKSTKSSENKSTSRYEKCGDATDQNNKKINAILKSVNKRCVKNDNNVNSDTKIHNNIRQFFKNDNFQPSAESVYDSGTHKQVSLDTIKEVSLNTTQDTMFRILSDSDSEETNADNEENLKKLKEFRQKNYFECHSVKSRINTKPSATSLNNHKCVYRFYLNDRLFPVPLNADYNNKIRCVECHLPMDAANNSTDEINGTIQAKVNFGEKDAQDMLLLLPVNDTLIIEEKRKEVKPNDEFVYFGVIKLKQDGDSIFNRTLPGNSLALKYQKGYRQFCNNQSFKYKQIDDHDVIVI